MLKKSFYLAAVLSTTLFAACQHDPTVLNSTWHKPGDSSPLPHNSAKVENTNQSATNQNVTNENTANRSEMKPETKSANNTADRAVNSKSNSNR